MNHSTHMKCAGLINRGSATSTTRHVTRPDFMFHVDLHFCLLICIFLRCTRHRVYEYSGAIPAGPAGLFSEGAEVIQLHIEGSVTRNATRSRG